MSTIPKSTIPSMPFWETKTLDELSPAEWESLCDGCGRCCLFSFEDDDGDYVTDVACHVLDRTTGRCSDYANRASRVDHCNALTPDMVREGWLPPTCAYRLVHEGRGLYWWHPLVSGDPDTVRAARISVAGRCRLTERDVPDTAMPRRERRWPWSWPRGSRRRSWP